MSLFDFIGSIFKPATDLVDELHVSDEERGQIEIKKSELRNKLAEIEARVSTKMLDLQSQVIEANAKIAVSEQQHGNLLSKSWRPLVSLGCAATLFAMGFEAIQYNQFIATICGGFLGIYAPLRSWEKKK